MFFYLSVCLFVRLSVACEICQIIRYVAAPGGERVFRINTDTVVCIMSKPIGTAEKWRIYNNNTDTDMH